MHCEEAFESLAAYALDALEADERVAMLEHLAECRAHDEELADLREVTGSLPMALAATAPPASLRGSLMDAFDAETAGPGAVAAPQRIAPPRSAPAESRGNIFDFFRRPALAYGVAAVLMVAVLGLAAWNLSLSSGDDTGVLTATTADGVNLRVVYLPDDGVAVFQVDMPPAPEGSIYQAWRIADGQPVSLGLLATNHGSTAFTADLDDAAAVAISVEPPGGSPAPTSEPIAVAEF